MTNVYTSSTDGMVKGITAASVAVVAVVVVVLARIVVAESPGWLRALLGAAIVLCVGLVGATYGYTPRGYRLEDGRLVIERPVSDVVVAFRDIVDARHEHAPLKGMWRVAGNGGLFGFWGKFRRVADKTNVAVYATRYHDGVVLSTAQGTMVITPDDPARFVDELKGRMRTG